MRHGRPVPCWRRGAWGRRARDFFLAAAAAASAPCLVAGAAEETLALDGLAPQQAVAWSEGRLVPQLPASWLQLRGPVGTVCVTGDDRVGKSTLLTLWGRNLTESEDFTFPAGHTRTSHTRGLWSAILPSEVTGLDFHLNLCDSQGLKQLPELEQWRLFSANVLIPSVLVYMLINVVQNDQLRDLARMAQQFQLLSSEDLGSFGRLLSPHLIVVVREESDLDGEAGPEAAHDLSAHLEEALNSPGFAEDKALIRSVFRTREAWALQELPLEARRALRASGGPSLVAGGAAAESSRAWRASGEAVLERVLAALDLGRADLPEGGPALSEWYRSVLETVNSREDGSMGRLVGHGERLAAGHRLRRLLQEWRGPTFLALAAASLLLAFGGCLGRWLDRGAWCTWIILCVCHIGTCPLVTTPLSGIIPRYCDQFASSGGPILRLACQEASAHTAAVLLAVLLGALSYPMLTAQLQWLLGLLPLPFPLQRSGAACTLAGAIAILGFLQDAGLDDASAGTAPIAPLAAAAALALAASLAGAELALKARHNRLSMRASENGRLLHSYIAERLEEVRQLEASREWAKHYRSCSPRDSLWRYRSVPVWRPAAVCTQACTLLAWAWLIHPHSDPVLALGVFANCLHLLWRLGRTLLRCTRFQPGRDEVDAWWEELEDASGDEEEDAACAAAGCTTNTPSNCSAASTASAPAVDDSGGTGGCPMVEPVPEPSPGASPAVAAEAASEAKVSARRRRRRCSSPGVPSPAQLREEEGTESESELQRRRSMEDMRRAQERLAAGVW